MERDVLLGCVLALSAFFVYLRYLRYHRYWAKRGMKGEDPLPLFNDLYTLVLRNREKTEQERRDKFGKVYGIFMNGNPRYMVADADVLRQICVKDFDVFTNHPIPSWTNKYQRLFLIWLNDQHWKRVRTLMAPALNSGKIKRMFKSIEQCADDLMQLIGQQLTRGEPAGAVLNVKDMFGMFTVDSISRCGYGLRMQRATEITDVHSLANRSDYMRDLLNMLVTGSLRLIVVSSLPKWPRDLLGLEGSPVSKYEPIMQRMRQWIEKRRASGDKKSDLLQSLMDARLDDELELSAMDQAENHHAGIADNKAILAERAEMQKSDSPTETSHAGSNRQPATQVRMSDMEIQAEAGFVLLAGFESTCNLLTATIYALAHHPDIQQRLYEELKSTLTSPGGQVEFDYDRLTACEYLDAVISESLRFVPPVPCTDRLAGRDYYVEKYNITIPKGSIVMLSMSVVHSDPDYWKEPQRFDPNRFMPGEREKIVPGSYIPFSIGPRFCLGMRFALTEAKIGVAKTLLSYKLEPAPGTSFPLKIGRIPLLISIKNPLVQFDRRQ